MISLPKRTLRLSLLAAAALALALACGSPAPRGARPLPRDGNILRADEIAAAEVATAYDAIMRLRPRFLMGRGPTSIDLPFGGGVRIYVDGVFQRSADDLRSVMAADIVYVRYLSAAEATTYWGTGFTSPVVYVLTRARR
jgi:hypothetical protein